MKRRVVLTSAAGAVAALAGVGVAWRAPSGNGAHADDIGTLWTQRFDKPGGGELVLATLKGRPVLLNFWATWCAPCVREMPLLDRLQRSQRAGGIQVVGLAVDSPTPVREFLVKMPMGFAIGLAGFGGVDLSKSLGNANGSLPFSVLVGRDGRLLERKLGALDDADLSRWTERALAGA